MTSGPVFAIIAALLFGISPVLCKTIVGELSPLALAGLLYLGSGVGLSLWMIVHGNFSFSKILELSSKLKWRLAGAILFGGVLAPIFLVTGVKGASAFEVSVLLNLEAVTTTLIAKLVFKEQVGARVWIGKA